MPTDIHTRKYYIYSNSPNSLASESAAKLSSSRQLIDRLVHWLIGKEGVMMMVMEEWRFKRMQRRCRQAGSSNHGGRVKRKKHNWSCMASLKNNESIDNSNNWKRIMIVFFKEVHQSRTKGSPMAYPGTVFWKDTSTFPSPVFFGSQAHLYEKQQNWTGLINWLDCLSKVIRCLW